MADDRVDLILSELREMRVEGQDTRDKVIILVEQAKDIEDHENRIRLLEQLKWGLPITGMTAIGAMILSAWTAKGS